MGAMLWAILSPSLLAQTGSVGQLKRTGFTPVLFYKKFRATSDLSFPVSSDYKTVAIRHSAGNLYILPNTEDVLEINSEIRITSLGKRKARRFLEKYLKIRLEDRGNKLYFRSAFEVMEQKKRVENDIVVSSPNLGAFMANPGAKIHTTIKVPAGVFLDIRDGSGKIKIEGIDNPMYIRDHSGSMHLSNLGGIISIRDGAGKLVTENTRDSLYIRDASGSIHIKESSGPIKLIDKAGEIKIMNAQAFVHVSDHSGHIYLKNLSQGLLLKDYSGKIALENIAYSAKLDTDTPVVKIRDRSGPIYLKKIPSSGVEIRDTSGKIVRQ